MEVFIMENKKKNRISWLITTAILVVAAALVLCFVRPGFLNGKKALGNEISFDVSVTLDGSDEICNKELSVKEGTTLIDAISNGLTEDGGVVYSDSQYGAYITEICGYSEDPDAGKYWMYTINGESAMVGASDYYPASGDEIVFDLSVLQW